MGEYDYLTWRCCLTTVSRRSGVRMVGTLVEELAISDDVRQIVGAPITGMEKKLALLEKEEVVVGGGRLILTVERRKMLWQWLRWVFMQVYEEGEKWLVGKLKKDVKSLIFGLLSLQISPPFLHKIHLYLQGIKSEKFI